MLPALKEKDCNYQDHNQILSYPNKASLSQHRCQHQLKSDNSGLAAANIGDSVSPCP